MYNLINIKKIGAYLWNVEVPMSKAYTSKITNVPNPSEKEFCKLLHPVQVLLKALFLSICKRGFKSQRSGS